MKKPLVSFLMVWMAGGILWAQLPRFDSVWVSPPQPVAGQDVGFLYRTTFPSANCNLVNYSLNQNMNTLTLHLYHFQGMLTMICQSQDSIYPGTYPAGTYQLMALLYYQGETVPRDTAFLNFTVLPQQAGLEETSVSAANMVLWPNPVKAGSTVNLGDSDDLLALEVRDVQGRLMMVHNVVPMAAPTLKVPFAWAGQVLAVTLRFKSRPEPLTYRLLVL